MITFIESGNRIATENFQIGEIYTITFTNGNYKTMCCTGIGVDFIMFQDKLPNALFCLTMGTAETVLTIDLGGGGTGTMNYNELENKPQINGITLIGNKTGSELGLVSQVDLDSYVTDTELATELASKQNQLTTPQLTAVNSGITSSLVTQITTNQNNISLVMTPNKGIITFENTYTPNNYQAHIRQYNNIVVGQLYIKFDTALPVTSPATVIAHLSDIAFPAMYSRFIVGVSNQLWEVPTSTALLLIDTNGDISVLPATGESKTAYICNFAYTITDPT